MIPPSTDGEHLALVVDGMSCGHCKARVEKTLGALTGVQAFAVDLASGAAEVRYRPSEVLATDIVAAVSDAGYPARMAVTE